MNKKKKILTYGLRYSDFASQRELFALRANGDIEIVGELAYDPDDEEIFYCRRSVEESLKLDFDLIIVCEGNVEDTWYSIAQSIGDHGNGSGLREKIIMLCDFVQPFHQDTEHRQVDILKEIVSASDEQISDKNWVMDRLFEYGFYPFFKLTKDPTIKGVHFSTCGILQVPDEFLDLCMFLSDKKFDKAIEIGVARGGSSYVMAAILYRNNPDMIYRMVDIEDSLVHFEDTVKIIPSIQKSIPSTSENFVKEEYDFCFIDADHSYEGIMTDWNNVGRYAGRLVVFHDIYAHEYDGLNGGTVRGWREIKTQVQDRDIREFSRYPDRWMGIGVVGG